jgi:hypothetical protein
MLQELKVVLSLKKEKFDISKLIAEIINDIEEKIVENKKNIKLSFELYNRNNNNNKIILEADKNRLVKSFAIF